MKNEARMYQILEEMAAIALHIGELSTEDLAQHGQANIQKKVELLYAMHEKGSKRDLKNRLHELNGQYHPFTSSVYRNPLRLLIGLMKNAGKLFFQ